MKNFRYFLLRILIHFYVSVSGAEFELDHKQHLSHLTAVRHPLPPNRESWLQSREYIRNTFQSFGLVTHTQEFNTKIATLHNSLVEVEGKNIIGESLSPVENSPVIMVGTYYDNTLEKGALAESGASVASLLETARVFQEMKREKMFEQNVTVLFVAFDLNVKNYIPLAKGKPGSYFLAKDWLSEYLKGGERFLGALLLGSVSSFNLEHQSQVLLTGYEQAFPETSSHIQATNMKADFLGINSRVDVPNIDFMKRFQASYTKLNSESDFHLEEFLLADGVKLHALILDAIKRSPQFDFWTHSPPLPAMLLTDMGVTRQDFDAPNCQSTCSLEVFWKDERKTFVEATTASLIQMLLNYQAPEQDNIPGTTTNPETPGNGCVSLPVQFGSILGWVLLCGTISWFRIFNV